MAETISYNVPINTESQSSEFIFPGRLYAHVEPKRGAVGGSGTSIFFSDYEIDDDFYKDLLIEKIENGEKIKQTDTDKIGERGYISGDIILTPARVVHRIIKDSDGKINVEQIGKISNPRISKKLEDILGDELKPNSLVLNFNVHADSSEGTVPNYFYYFDSSVHRQNRFDSSVLNKLSFNDENEILNGEQDSSYNYKRMTFEIGSRFKSNLSSDTLHKIIDHGYYSYFVKLYIKCNKKYSGPESSYDSCVFIKSNINGFDFYKEISVPVQLDPNGSSVNTMMDISQLDKIFISENGFNSKYYYPFDDNSPEKSYPNYYIINGIIATVSGGGSQVRFDASVIEGTVDGTAKKSEVLPKQTKRIVYYESSTGPLPRYTLYDTFEISGPRIILSEDTSVRFGSRERYFEKIPEENNVAVNAPYPNRCIFRRGDSASASNYFLEHLGSMDKDTNPSGNTSYNSQDEYAVMDLLNYPRILTDSSTDYINAIKSTLTKIFSDSIGWAEFILINNKTGEKTIYTLSTEINFTSN